MPATPGMPALPLAVKHPANVSHGELHGCPSEAIVGHVPIGWPPSEVGASCGGPTPEPEPQAPVIHRVR